MPKKKKYRQHIPEGGLISKPVAKPKKDGEKLDPVIATWPPKPFPKGYMTILADRSRFPLFSGFTYMFEKWFG